MSRKTGLPKFCSFNVDRHGKRRILFRRRGFSTYLPAGEDFAGSYAAALGGSKDGGTAIGAAQTVAGSINALIVS
jgi:hypothetical protein